MNSNYAGFWLRFVAMIIDGIILSAVYFIVVAPVIGLLGFGMSEEIEAFDPDDPEGGIAMLGAITAMWGMVQVIFFVIQVLYYSIMESSKYQATVGKLVLGIKVTDMDGNKQDFVKAFVRNISKIVSSIIMLIGYIMAGFTEKKQALHDMIAGALVVRK